MRRYKRSNDHYQSEKNILELLNKMERTIFPDGASRAHMKKLLFAVQHVGRYQPKTARTGRRSPFEREFLFNASSRLTILLNQETGGRISLLRFISTYLPVLAYPPDIKTALAADEITLEEARILSRINKKNLGACGVRRKAVEIRKELLSSHLKRMGTQAELRRRVAEKLNGSPDGEASKVSSELVQMMVIADDLLKMNEFDTEHLFWEEIKSLVFLAREVDTALVDDDALEHILKDLDSIKLRLIKFRKKPLDED